MKLVELEKEKFDHYVKNHPQKSHFLQSKAWGEFSKEVRGLTPYYLGLENESDIVGATLLLQKHLPLGYSYFYAPRGFVIDFTDKRLLKEMTTQVISFCKSKKSIFLKIDPDIIYHKTNYLEEPLPLPYQPEEIISNLKKLGFRHLGFTKNFETMQPRYTFRIDLTQPKEEIEQHFSKTTKQRIKKAEKLGCEVSIGTEKNIDDFYQLMVLTEARKDFISHDKNYYERLYNIFNQENKATLFLGKINIEKVLKEKQERKKELDQQYEELPKENMSKSAKNKEKEILRQQETLDQDIKKYEDALNKYGKELILSAHWIMEYGDKAWVLYAGNHNVLTETYANYLTYEKHLNFCQERGLKIYDQFGTIGDLNPNNPRLGLHEFKKKFGGDYVEFIGEFDYVTKPILYFIFKKLVPLYRNIIRNKSKKEVQHEASRNQ